MKGKDLIECIKKYELEEYDFPICGEDGLFTGYISIEEAARTYKLPISRVRTLIQHNNLRIVNVLNKKLISKEEADAVLAGYSKFAKINTEKWKERRHNGFSRKRAN